MSSAARHARAAWSNASAAPKTAMTPSPVNLSTVPPYCVTTAVVRSRSPAMISRSRSAPTAFAMSIECTTSANNTVTCLYSATRGEAVVAVPHSSQNLAFRRSSVPQVAHATTAPIRPSPAGPHCPRHKDRVREPERPDNLTGLTQARLATEPRDDGGSKVVGRVTRFNRRRRLGSALLVPYAGPYRYASLTTITQRQEGGCA